MAQEEERDKNVQKNVISNISDIHDTSDIDVQYSTCDSELLDKTVTDYGSCYKPDQNMHALPPTGDPLPPPPPPPPDDVAG